MGLGPIWPKARLARDAKRPKPTYHIKTGGHYRDGGNFKARLRELGCLPRGQLQGNPSRVLSPPVDRPSAYEKVVREKDTNAENT